MISGFRSLSPNLWAEYCFKQIHMKKLKLSILMLVLKTKIWSPLDCL